MSFNKKLLCVLAVSAILNCLLFIYSPYQIEVTKMFSDFLPKFDTTLSLNYSFGTGEHQSNKCTMETCFNFKRCNASVFKAFVYPTDVWNRTEVNSILGKTYFTENKKNACIYIFFWEPGSNLNELEFWQEMGSNHIIINLDINKEGPPHPGHAIVAQPHFRPFSFRAGFDYILPFYNSSHSNDMWKILSPFFPTQRKYWISYLTGPQPALNTHSEYKLLSNKLSKYLKSHDSSLLPIKIFSNCSPFDIWSCSKKERLQIFTNSTFTIILIPPHLSSEDFGIVFQIHLVEILLSGSIPVLVGDEHYLPLQEYINWKNLLVTVNSNMLTKFLTSLSSLIDTDIFRFKKHGRHVMEMIFASKKSLLAAILDSMHQREGLPVPCFDLYHPKILFKHQPNSNNQNQIYDQPGSFREGKYSLLDLRIPPEAISFVNPQLSPGKSWPPEKFTVLILTYRRQYILYNILNQFHNMPFLDRIVVVWNDISSTVDEKFIPKLNVPIYVISSGKNSLNNKFLPYDVIRTDAIFNIDDDMTLPKESILLAFRVWRENRDRLVGFPGRYHAWSKSEHEFLYKGDTRVSGLSLVLTSACFVHKHYTYLYTYMMQPAIRNYVETNLNCEDIAMNFLVSHVTRKPPLKVTKKLFYPCKYCGKTSISKSKGHNKKRRDSLNFFQKVYGYMPLIFTQFSTDYLEDEKLYNSKFLTDI